MESNKNFEKLNESVADSAKRQDDIFNRIETIVKENPESAKQYLQHLTQSSKWELYSRIYGKFAYITLLITFLAVALVLGLKKLKTPDNQAIVQQFIQSKPELRIKTNEQGNYVITYQNNETKESQDIGLLQNFNAKLQLKKTNDYWQVLKNKVVLGKINTHIQKISMEFDGKPYKINTAQHFGNDQTLMFKIIDFFDYTVPNSSETTTRTVYRVIFGEKTGDTTLWNTDTPIEIMKSDNARGIINGSNTNMHFIQNDLWKNAYIVELSIGKLASDQLFVYYMFGNAYALSLE